MLSAVDALTLLINVNSLGEEEEEGIEMRMKEVGDNEHFVLPNRMELRTMYFP